MRIMCELVLGFSHVDVKKERAKLVSPAVSPVRGNDGTMAVLVAVV